MNTKKQKKEKEFYFINNYSLGKCVLLKDSAFPGCGFRLSEKEGYDTPIIAEIAPNSPAKRRY